MIEHCTTKRTGKHFTPPELANLVARRVVALLETRTGPLRVLDPSCGDGNLLVAIAEAMSSEQLDRTTLVGIERNGESLAAARGRLEHLPCAGVELKQADFLGIDRGNDSDGFIESVDAIIANPPYVRTQVLGASRTRRLSRTFGLSGRIDLYQAFLVAMSHRLKPAGVLGAITSNRFFTTKAGSATREFLRTHYWIDELFDLGDTKLFEAAVLPALIFARRRRHESNSTSKFVRVYRCDPKSTPKSVTAMNLMDALTNAEPGLFRTDEAVVRITTGTFDLPHDSRVPWTMLDRQESQWVSSIDAATDCRLGDVAKIRVGIKTTADSVFIRSDWNRMELSVRPEAKHLRPILSRAHADKFCPRPSNVAERSVLYTHEVADRKRRAIDFEPHSPSWRYLTAHRERLESRRYVANAGRRWYEIWVPQYPDDWKLNKIVFPDISIGPKFFLDRDGRIVDGNCYWLTTKDQGNLDKLFFILGVVNSKTIQRYHDLVFQNRLYAGRRRHTTEYVSQYPLPSITHPTATEIISAVSRLVEHECVGTERSQLCDQVDELVAHAFGQTPLSLSPVSGDGENRNSKHNG